MWVVCDVYENDLGEVHLGDTAEIRLNAYPDKTYHGKVADISRVLDPATRSAKVRIVLLNRDGSLRPGMFAVATFRSRKSQSRDRGTRDCPDTAARQGLGVPKGRPQRFHRLEVHTFGRIADGMHRSSLCGTWTDSKPEMRLWLTRWRFPQP